MKDNQAKYPQLRFKGFTDPWEQRKFEYLLDENDGIRRGPFGSALKKECFVSQSDYVVYEQQNAIYNKYETRYNITKDKFEELKKFELKPEDFIMSGAGTIGRISRVPHGIDKGVFNQALIRFRIDNRITDSEYFLQFIRADFMQKKLTSTNPGSAITNLVPMSEVKKWGILVPQINEQSKIGIFFKQLDKTITLHQRKLAKLKELKQGYLQKLFPENGSKFPQLRFAGFADAWEERKLEELSLVLTGFPFKNEDFVDNGKYLVITNGNIQNESSIVDVSLGNRVDDLSDEIKERYYLNKNDILVTMDGTVGRTAKVVDDNMILAQRVARLVANKNTEFVYQLLNQGSFFNEMKKVSHGGTIKHISLNEISNYSATVPGNDIEQQKIGLFFKQLDNTVALHQRKLEKLQELKKGYLQKMFC